MELNVPTWGFPTLGTPPRVDLSLTDTDLVQIYWSVLPRLHNDGDQAGRRPLFSFSPQSLSKSFEAIAGNQNLNSVVSDKSANSTQYI